MRSALRKADDEPRFLGVRSPPTVGLLPDAIDVDEQRWDVVFAASPLQARLAMVRAGEEGRAVLLTPLSVQELGLEVVARLGLRRLESIQPWQVVRELFQARQIDARLVREGWIAEELIANQPGDGYPPVASGLLDLDSAWRVLFGKLGLDTARPGVADLLEASLNELQRRWKGSSESLQKGMAKRLADVAGAVGERIASVLAEGHGDDLVALGLILHLLSARALAGDPRAVAVRTRLESLGLRVDDRTALAAWSEQAEQLCRRLADRDFIALDGVLAAAEGLVSRLQADDLVEASSILRSGYRARTERFRQELEAATESSSPEARQTLSSAFDRLSDHLLAQRDPRERNRQERCRHALRLVEWLATDEAAGESLGAFAQAYRDETAYADLARHAMVLGESDKDLAAAFDAVSKAVRERRERENSAFAERVSSAFAGKEGTGDVLPIEGLIPKVVVPLAEHVKVLLVVMDGMSQAVILQLADDIRRRSSLQRMAPTDRPSWPPVIGLLPSVTEVCRTSLLCGRRSVGTQAEELDGLEQLASQHGWRGRVSRKPMLFHKGTLGAAGGVLASEVRESLQSELRVVAVVVNAVDDQLPKGGQLRPNWSLDNVPDLQALVALAEVERRALVLTSDHGHVVEEGVSEKCPSEHVAERWRPTSGVARDGELEIRGERVLLPSSGGPIVVPWSERVRYSSKHAGYHGGVSAQEMVVPLAVFVPQNEAVGLEGWGAEVVAPPEWWHGEAPRQPAAPMPPRRSSDQPEKKKEPAQTTLFEPASAAAPSGGGSWIEALLASPNYASQRKLAGRTPPPDDDVREVLSLLDAAGGALTWDALRNQSLLPDARLRGLLAAVNRILNVDGYAVIDVDHGSGTVRVDRQLLVTQFELEVE